MIPVIWWQPTAQFYAAEGMEECYQAYGEVDTQLGLAMLQQYFPTSQIRGSVHYPESQYLLLEGEDSSMTFERVNNGFLINSDATSSRSLCRLCQHASAILAAQRLRHRIELYDLAQDQYDYFDYQWPQ